MPWQLDFRLRLDDEAAELADISRAEGGRRAARGRFPREHLGATGEHTLGPVLNLRTPSPVGVLIIAFVEAGEQRSGHSCPDLGRELQCVAQNFLGARGPHVQNLSRMDRPTTESKPLRVIAWLVESSGEIARASPSP